MYNISFFFFVSDVNIYVSMAHFFSSRLLVSFIFFFLQFLKWTMLEMAEWYQKNNSAMNLDCMIKSVFVTKKYLLLHGKKNFESLFCTSWVKSKKYWNKNSLKNRTKIFMWLTTKNSHKTNGNPISEQKILSLNNYLCYCRSNKARNRSETFVR